MPASTGAEGIFSGPFRWVTIGMCMLILLAAFESLAVTTVMPAISADLDGAHLYALAFGGPLAVGVVGMVVAGNWADRYSPKSALYLSCVLFALGLVIAGTSVTMEVFVAGRLVHGFGGGGAIVSLYVIVARLYPARLQPKIFAGFAAAWVVPSLIGPFIAGLVAEQLSWHWVFLGVIGLIVPAFVMVIPALRSVRLGSETAERVPWRVGPILWSLLTAVAVMGLNLATEVSGWLAWVLPALAFVVTLVALRPLLPAGALRAVRGLPSVVLMRGMIGTAFFGAEVYLPYLLIDEYGLDASIAGLALSAGGVFWAAGSWFQGRTADRWEALAHLRLGTGMLVIALAVTLAMTVWMLPPVIAFFAWAAAGFGMGMMLPRLSVLTFALSSRQAQGFNSAALTIADSMGAAIALALSAFIFTGLAPLGAVWSFAGCFALALAVGIVAAVLAPRIMASGTEPAVESAGLAS